MDFYPEYVQILYTQQQNRFGTDCSFEFEVPSENGEVVKKFVQGHKVILSAVSEYFANNFKPEWERNQPIPIKNFEHAVFDKLIKAIYLPTISFDNLEQGCKLYEAAHFYCIEKTLKLIRDQIIEHWKSHRSVEISPMVNVAFKYGDEKLKYFSSKVFAQNAHFIITENKDFYKYPYDAINFFYLLDDLVINESDLLIGLQNYKEETTIKKELLQPAIDAIRFQFIPKDYIQRTILLTDTEKYCLSKLNEPKDVLPKSQQPRKFKKFFYYLSPETQAEFRDKFSTKYCWVCKENHSVHECNEAEERYTIYESTKHEYVVDEDGNTLISVENFRTRVHLDDVENYRQYNAKKILRLLQSVDDENFKHFKNIDKEIEDIYLWEPEQNEYLSAV